MRSYLDHDRRISAAAKALSVHENTLRYRLQKFEQATGARLDATEHYRASSAGPSRHARKRLPGGVVGIHNGRPRFPLSWLHSPARTDRSVTWFASQPDDLLNRDLTVRTTHHGSSGTIGSGSNRMSVITAAPPVSRARQLAAATVGNIVEWFDWYVYSMLALYFSAQFFPKTGDPIVPLLSAMAIFAVGFFMRPLGGFLGGIVADRFGRKKALTATVMLMGVGSLLVAIAPTYDQVGVLAHHPGGGPAPAGAVHRRRIRSLLDLPGGIRNPQGRRGFFSSFLYIGATLGNLAAISSVALLVAGLPDEAMREWGWRVPFAIGTLGAAAGLFIRRFAEETLVAEDAAPGSGPGAARALRSPPSSSSCAPTRKSASSCSPSTPPPPCSSTCSTPPADVCAHHGRL